jgi:hypothetical protein
MYRGKLQRVVEFVASGKERKSHKRLQSVWCIRAVVAFDKKILIQFNFQVEFLNINQYDIDMRSVKFTFIINRFC